MLILLVSVALAGTAHEGHSPGLTAGLFLLGLGWSACMVAGSTLLTDAVGLPTGRLCRAVRPADGARGGRGGGALAGIVVGSFGLRRPRHAAAAFLLAAPVAVMLIPACRSLSNTRSA